MIHIVTYDNYDGFQHLTFIFSQIFFHYFKDYLMMQLTLGSNIQINKKNKKIILTIKIRKK
jgi:hypothetical protein